MVCSGLTTQHSHTPKTSSRSHSLNKTFNLRHRSAPSDGRSQTYVGHRPCSDKTDISMIIVPCGHHCWAMKPGHVTVGVKSHLCRNGTVAIIACHRCHQSNVKYWYVTSKQTDPSTVPRHHCPLDIIIIVGSGHVTRALNLYVYADFVRHRRRSDSDDDEIDDKALNNILIVTQTPPYMKKHPQGDRHPNPDYVPRAKMTAEIAKMINDGLCYYEEELWNDDEVRGLTILPWLL